jgi:hypothetical protein
MARSLMYEVLRTRRDEGGEERNRDYLRMRNLIFNAEDLDPARMKELICLRFGSDDRRVLKQFWLRLHPDKTSSRCEHNEEWIEALKSARRLLDLCEQYSDFERLNEYEDYRKERELFYNAVSPLWDACVPDDARVAKPLQQGGGGGELVPNQALPMPTGCAKCGVASDVRHVLSDEKYHTRAAVARLVQHEWQHATCSNENCMCPKRLGSRGLAGTTRNAKRNSYMDNLLGTEIRKSRRPRVLVYHGGQSV